MPTTPEKTNTKTQLLNFFLGYFALGNIFSLYTYLYVHAAVPSLYVPNEVRVIRAILSVVNLLVLWGIWKRRKVAVYAYGVILAANLLLTIFTSTRFVFLGVSFALIFNFLLYYKLIKPMWKDFT